MKNGEWTRLCESETLIIWAMPALWPSFLIDSPGNGSDNEIMLEGRCPKCGTHQIGWALQFERHQSCPNCGTGFDLYEDGKLIGRGFSPFTAPELIIRPPRVPSEEDSLDS